MKTTLQRLQRLRHGLERRAVAQRPRLGLHQIDVVAPVVDGLLALEAAHMARHLHPFSHQHELARVHPQAQDRVHVARGHAVAVALEVDQPGGRDSNRLLDIAIKGLGAGHEARLLVLEHLGHGELGPLGVSAVLPALAAALAQPGVERLQIRPAPLGGLPPDLAAPVLHVLLHHPLLPTRGRVAELGIEQVVRAHGGKAHVHAAGLARAHLVHSGLHVVVDAAPRHPAEGGKRPGVGIEQHLVALRRVGREPERTRGRQLGVRNLQAPAQARFARSRPLQVGQF